MVVHYPRTVWKNSYAEHEITGKTYNLKKLGWIKSYRKGKSQHWRGEAPCTGAGGGGGTFDNLPPFM